MSYATELLSRLATTSEVGADKAQVAEARRTMALLLGLQVIGFGIENGLRDIANAHRAATTAATERTGWTPLLVIPLVCLATFVVAVLAFYRVKAGG
jgi:hypothetical protein